MGNIVTPDQGLLPLPAYALTATPYPWWLTAALAIWALLALLCCWLLLLLYLLRYCCKWWRHRKYAADRKSIRKRFFGRSAAGGEQGAYVTKDQHFASAPLPPVPPYASSGEVFESQIVEDEFFGNRRPYVTSGAAAVDNAAYGADSESVSEEEIIRGNRSRRGGGGVVTRVDEVIRTGGGGGARRGSGVITRVDEVIRTGGGAAAARGGGVTENLETNIERNITKNYYINEEQNYFIQNEPSVQHDQTVQSLPAPTVTTVNMAAERIADNPNWESTNIREGFDQQPTKHASAEIVAADPSLFRQDVRYERPPNILTHRPITPEAPKLENRKLPMQTSIVSEDSSITSEMSGHDSESIYETIRVVKPKRTVIPRVDERYRTAGVDEVEIEIQDMARSQKGNPKTTTTYEELVSSSNMPRQNLERRGSSSVSSSSTLNNLASNQSQANNFRSGEEEKEETVTETVKTEQIQTTYRQIGQNLDGSAFFIPLTHQQEEQNNEERIIIPITTTSSIHHEEQPALQEFKNNDQ